MSEVGLLDLECIFLQACCHLQQRWVGDGSFKLDDELFVGGNESVSGLLEEVYDCGVVGTGLRVWLDRLFSVFIRVKSLHFLLEVEGQ